MLFLLLADSTGSIRVRLYGDRAKRYDNIFQCGRSYCVSNGRVTLRSNPQSDFDGFYTRYELAFTSDTTVRHCSNCVIGRASYSFTQFSCLVELPCTTSVVDVIGVMRNISVEGKYSTSTHLRNCGEVELVDASIYSVILTLWNDAANHFEGRVGQIVAVKSAFISKLYKRSLRATRLSQLWIEPASISEATSLRAWYDTTGRWQAFEPVGEKKSWDVINEKAPWKSIKQVAIEFASKTELAVQFFTQQVFILQTVKESLIYECCPRKGCLKRVDYSWDSIGLQRARCSHCDVYVDRIEYRLRISLLVSDLTDTAWITAFETEASKLLAGKTGQDVAFIIEDKQMSAELMQQIDRLRYSDHVFCLQVKRQTYQVLSRRVLYMPINTRVSVGV